jgi:hypothetical protein
MSQSALGRKALNKKRSDATGALYAVIRAIQERTLTHKIVTRAQETARTSMTLMMEFAYRANEDCRLASDPAKQN